MSMKKLDYLTIDEVANELNVCKKTIYDLVGTGQLRARRIPGTRKMYIHRADLERALETV